MPAYIRSDNGDEFAAKLVREWLGRLGPDTLLIKPRSPWENGCNESFNGKRRDELLNGQIFYTLKEAKIIIEQWRRHYNTVRPHSLWLSSSGARNNKAAAYSDNGVGTEEGCATLTFGMDLLCVAGHVLRSLYH